MVVWWTAIAILVQPQRPRRIAAHAAASIGAAIAMWWVVFSRHRIAPVDWNGWQAFVQLGFAFPTDSFNFFAASLPLTTLLLTIAGGLAVLAPLSSLSAAVRPSLCVVATTIAGLSFLDVGYTSRYLLVPAPFIVLALAALPYLLHSAIARRGGEETPSVMWQTTGAVVMVSIALLDWRVVAAERIRGRVDVPPGARLAVGDAAERVITNDEVAAAFNLGRVDYWFVHGEDDFERFGLPTPAGPKGLYAGAAILHTPEALRALAIDCVHSTGCVFAVFRTGRFSTEPFEGIVRDLASTLDGDEIIRSAFVSLTRIPGRVAPP
jgi:hypothetical protein